MNWYEDVEELKRQEAMAREMGGKEGVEFQHNRGKLTIRERIELLADADSFQEIGTLAGTPTWEGDRLVHLKPSNTVIGTCRVAGRKVAFSGGDFTIRGGASDANVGNKRGHAEGFALSARIPFVHLLDATGGSVKPYGKTRLVGEIHQG